MVTTEERELFAGLKTELAIEEMRHGAGGIAVIGSLEPGVLYPGDAPDALVESRSAYLTPLPSGVKAANSCSDDRPPTDESAEAIDAHYRSKEYKRQYPHTKVLNPKEGYARIFGGIGGIAKNFLVSGCVVYGEEFYDRIGGVDGAIDMVDSVTDGRSLFHSDDKNEGDRKSLAGEGAVGCLYCMAMGATCGLHDKANPIAKENDHIISGIARVNQANYFNAPGQDDRGKSDMLVDQLFAVQRYFGDRLAAHTHDQNPMSFQFGRPQIAAALARISLPSGVQPPAAVLDGSHVGAEETLVMNNYHLDQVSNPTAAKAAGLEFYGGDHAVIANDVGPLLQEHDIPPELFLRAALMDTAPVRAALVANDKVERLKGRYDPTLLPMGFVGNPREAAEALQDLWGN